MAHLWRVLLVATIACSITSSNANVPGRLDIERALSAENYDKFVPPQNVELYIGFHVNNMAFDYQRGTLDINVYMRLMWEDRRLKGIFNGYNVSDWHRVRMFKEHIALIWIPDIFIKNSDKVERIDALVPELLMTVNKNGSVWYVPRLVKTVYCPDLRKGNRRTTCNVSFESYGYSNRDLHLGWLRNPINMEKGLTIQGQELEDTSFGQCGDGSGAYPCLEASFTWRRLPPWRVYEIGIYISSIMLLIVSWLGFWTPPGDRRIFLGLGIAVVLSILYMSVTQYQEYAYIEIVTTAQTWLVFCMVMDLAMILEYAFAHVLIRIIPATFKALCRCRVPQFNHILPVKDYETITTELSKSMLFENEDEMKPASTQSAEGGESGVDQERATGAMRVGYTIDMISGVFIFPVAFVIFLIAFMSSFLPFV